MLPEGWKLTTLGEVAQISSGGTPDRSEPSYWGGDIPWVTTGEIQFNTITDTTEKITTAGLKNSSAKLFPPGTLLMAMYGQGKTRGQIAKLGIEACTNQNSAAILFHKNQDPDFYFHYLASRYEDIREFGNSGGISHLNAGLLRLIDVPSPPYVEQQAMAKMLTIWDETIVITEKLLTNSRCKFQGLSQTLLFGTRQVSEAFPSWRQVPIGSLLRTVKRPVFWDDDKSYPLISVRRRSGGAVHRETLYGHEILTKKLNAIEAGDFLISKMQVVHGAMAIVPKELAHMYVSDSYITMQAIDPSLFDVGFFGWLSTTPEIRRAALRSSHGVHIEKMTFDLDLFLREKVSVPSSLEEQQAICKILETSQKEIQALEQQVSALKAEKRALMADLLTGKRRVKLPSTDTVATPP